jgi:hypothetical protein
MDKAKYASNQLPRHHIQFNPLSCKLLSLLESRLNSFPKSRNLSTRSKPTVKSTKKAIIRIKILSLRFTNFVPRSERIARRVRITRQSRSLVPCVLVPLEKELLDVSGGLSTSATAILQLGETASEAAISRLQPP